MSRCAVATIFLTALVVGCSSSSGEQDESFGALILDGTEGESIDFPAHATRRLASSSSSQSGLSLFEIVIPPRSGGAPPHTHINEDEFFYVRSGSPTFLADGVRKQLNVGGFTLLPRNGMHAVWNDTDEPAILLVGTSKGKFDDFFDAVALEVRASQAETPLEVGEVMDRLGGERGIEIHMDSLPIDVAILYGLSAP